MSNGPNVIVVHVNITFSKCMSNFKSLVALVCLKGSGEGPKCSGEEPQGSGEGPKGEDPNGSGADPKGSGEEPNGSGEDPTGSGEGPKAPKLKTPPLDGHLLCLDPREQE